MKKTFQTILNFFKKNSQLHLLLGPLVGATLYVLTQYIPFERTIIHVPLDDKIPLLMGFVYPYLVIYLYVLVPLFYICFTDRKSFVKFTVALSAAYTIAIGTFLIFPTQIDFRPEFTGTGLTAFACKLVAAADNPVNVCPSLHVILSTLTHLFTFTFGPMKNKKVLRILSAILSITISVSTLFVKQHSVIDVAAGFSVAALVTLVVLLVFKKTDKKQTEK